MRMFMSLILVFFCFEIFGLNEIYYMIHEQENNEGINVFNADGISRHKFVSSKYRNCRFSRQNFSESIFDNSVFKLSFFEGTALRNAKFFSCELKKIQFDDANLTDAQFSNNSYSGSSFMRSILRGADLSNAVFVNNTFNSATFENAILEGVSFIECDLSFTNFNGANLRDVHFDDVNLEGASFAGADLHGATYANLGNKVPITPEWLKAKTTLKLGPAPTSNGQPRGAIHRSWGSSGTRFSVERRPDSSRKDRVRSFVQTTYDELKRVSESEQGRTPTIIWHLE